MDGDERTLQRRREVNGPAVHADDKRGAAHSAKSILAQRSSVREGLRHSWRHLAHLAASVAHEDDLGAGKATRQNSSRLVRADSDFPFPTRKRVQKNIIVQPSFSSSGVARRLTRAAEKTERMAVVRQLSRNLHVTVSMTARIRTATDTASPSAWSHRKLARPDRISTPRLRGRPTSRRTCAVCSNAQRWLFAASPGNRGRGPAAAHECTGAATGKNAASHSIRETLASGKRRFR